MTGRKKVGRAERLGSLPQEILFAELVGTIGAFEFDLVSKRLVWTPQVATPFGFDRPNLPAEFEEWLRRGFPDDPLKIRNALDLASESGSFYVEFRAKQTDGKLRWLAGKGQALAQKNILRGTFYEIDERKQLEAKLLAVNETLEARVGELREEARTLEVLNRTGIAIGAELDLERLVQIVTDAGVELCGAQVGAFSITSFDRTASLTLFTLYRERRAKPSLSPRSWC